MGMTILDIKFDHLLLHLEMDDNLIKSIYQGLLYALSNNHVENIAKTKVPDTKV
jgi:hypothetical protein